MRSLRESYTGLGTTNNPQAAACQAGQLDTALSKTYGTTAQYNVKTQSVLNYTPKEIMKSHMTSAHPFERWSATA